MGIWEFAILGLSWLASSADAYKLVVLGDIHGDVDGLKALLEHNGVIDTQERWLDSTTQVICLGDLIGRGHQDKDVLEFVKRMQDANHPWRQQLGNHEIMQLRDDWRYAEDGDGIGFGSLANRQEALRKGSVLGDWMRGLPAIQQIADNLFVHAGMMDQRNYGRSINDINAEIAVFLQQDSPRTVYDDLIWDRDLIEGAYNGRTCDRIPTILAPHAGAVRLFLGHTTVYSSRLGGSGQKDPLVMCNSTLHAIDVGISRWMNNNPRNYMLTINDFIPSTTSMELMVIPPLGPVRDCRRDYDYSDFRNGYSPQRYARCGVSGTCCRSYSGSNACYYTAEDQSMCDNLPPTCDYQPYEDGGFTGSNPQCTP